MNKNKAIRITIKPISKFRQTSQILSLTTILFFLVNSFIFAIPDFKDIQWGDSVGIIKKQYPKAKKEFMLINNVIKLSYQLKDRRIKKQTFYFFKNKLYKLQTEFNPSIVHSNNIKSIFNKLSKKWGSAISNSINEVDGDFNIKGNSKTWTVNSTYISLIGEDYFDSKGNLINSKLLLEYGLIDPGKVKKDSSLIDLILKK